jgi:tyrosyl-tRNA synthetase
MSKIVTDEKQIDEVLKRGVEEVIVKENLRKRMMAGEKLRIKLGIDPTGSVLHLGHAVVLRKLRDFQKLGHQVIFLIGDFTARIGDPTGRSSARKPMTDEEIKSNMEDYKEQAGRIIDLENVEVRYNSEWLAKLNLKDLILLTSKITYAQMAQRADFKNRIKKDLDLSIQEFLYPAMQGYDSVALKADVELGGTDQKFNLLMGRQLQKRYGQKPQDVITCPLLEGLDGVEKMSKSVGNYIALNEEPDSMYGKVMSIPDKLIFRYYELCTEISGAELDEIKKALGDSNVNPRDYKMRLAYEIVKANYDKETAGKAQSYFVKTIQRKEAPEETEEVKVRVGTSLIDLLVGSGLAFSRSEAKRKIVQGGVKLGEQTISDINHQIGDSDNGRILRVGKRNYRRIVL